MPPNTRSPAVLADGRALENQRIGWSEHPEDSPTDKVRQLPGRLLSHAASAAFGAQRFALACLMGLQEADAALVDQTFVGALDLGEVDLPFLIESLGVLADNLQRIADAYGHDQVAKRFRGSAS